MSVEGATDAEAFEAYVEHFLAPSLCEGQVMVLDGLGAHRTQKVRELIEGRGADLLVLALLLARDEPHRGGFQQDQAPRA
jgi:transposase